MLDGTDTSAGKRPSVKRHYAETRTFEKLSRKQLRSEPQLPRNHDGDAVAHSLGFLHVVSGQDGSALTVLKSGSHGPPTRRNANDLRTLAFLTVALLMKLNTLFGSERKETFIWENFSASHLKQEKGRKMFLWGKHHLTTCAVWTLDPSLMKAHPVRRSEDSRSCSRQNTTADIQHNNIIQIL